MVISNDTQETEAKHQEHLRALELHAAQRAAAAAMPLAAPAAAAVDEPMQLAAPAPAPKRLASEAGDSGEEAGGRAKHPKDDSLPVTIDVKYIHDGVVEWWVQMHVARLYFEYCKSHSMFSKTGQAYLLSYSERPRPSSAVVIVALYRPRNGVHRGHGYGEGRGPLDNATARAILRHMYLSGATLQFVELSPLSTMARTHDDVDLKDVEAILMAAIREQHAFALAPLVEMAISVLDSSDAVPVVWWAGTIVKKLRAAAFRACLGDHAPHLEVVVKDVMPCVNLARVAWGGRTRLFFSVDGMHPTAWLVNHTQYNEEMFHMSCSTCDVLMALQRRSNVEQQQQQLEQVSVFFQDIFNRLPSAAWEKQVEGITGILRDCVQLLQNARAAKSASLVVCRRAVLSQLSQSFGLTLIPAMELWPVECSEVATAVTGVLQTLDDELGGGTAARVMTSSQSAVSTMRINPTTLTEMLAVLKRTGLDNIRGVMLCDSAHAAFRDAGDDALLLMVPALKKAGIRDVNSVMLADGAHVTFRTLGAAGFVKMAGAVRGLGIHPADSVLARNGAHKTFRADPNAALANMARALTAAGVEDVGPAMARDGAHKTFRDCGAEGIANMVRALKAAGVGDVDPVMASGSAHKTFRDCGADGIAKMAEALKAAGVENVGPVMARDGAHVTFRDCGAEGIAAMARALRAAGVEDVGPAMASNGAHVTFRECGAAEFTLYWRRR